MNAPDNAVAQMLRTRVPQRMPRIAVILGSGWSGITSHVQDAVRVPYAELEGFPHADVQGHSGELWLGRIGEREVAVMAGRKHTYEDGDCAAMKAPLRALRALGCSVLVQTNAAGSVVPAMQPGSLMVLRDHINFPQRSPLVGERGAERFVDMSDAYDARLRALAMEVAGRGGLKLHEGVYAWNMGPQFETVAEIRMFQRLGADAVGMSTVPETIIARHAGMRVLAFSLMTNMAAGLSGERLSHAHTLDQARAAGETASGLLAAVIREIDP